MTDSPLNWASPKDVAMQVRSTGPEGAAALRNRLQSRTRYLLESRVKSARSVVIFNGIQRYDEQKYNVSTVRAPWRGATAGYAQLLVSRLPGGSVRVIAELFASFHRRFAS